ncbi:MFS transporter [Gordonia humi]|uniref:Putative MFS transporter n=1 Tax=Gordonia humi TaxID=686429 RepID=A0A840EYK7_9ACTN|nr:MFS transporter [Gordonia humi]MBB4138175.1 putative MFS transporter [Gordonia humi]
MNMFQQLDSPPGLTGRQRRLAFVSTGAVCLEFLDYFLIGLILTFLVGDWGLSFGQSSVILLASGIGAIVGAFYFGRLADRIGRRPVFVITIAVFSIATGALALTPDSASVGWIYLALLRVVVGFGAGGLYVVDLPLVQEFMPAAKRGRVTGLVTSAIPVGFLLGSLLVWLLSDAIGWRGILAIAAAFGGILFFMRVSIPESPRYLVREGRPEAARRSIAWALEVPLDAVSADPGEVPVDNATKKVGLKSLLAYPRSLSVSSLTNLGMQTGYYGLSLWTPTLLVMVLGISPAETGMYMVFVTLGALAGRFWFAFLAEAIGRRRAGALAGLAAASFLVLATVYDQAYLGGVSIFFLLLIITYFFGEGGFAVVGPYSGEVWPSALRTTGMGFAYGFGGIGKVIGPLGLGLLLGSSNLVKPEVEVAGFGAGFIYFAAWYLLCALVFVFFGLETRGKSLEQLDQELEGQHRRSGSRSLESE